MHKVKAGLLLTLLIGGVVLAGEHVGIFRGCDDCSLGSFSGPEESIFIRTTVNQSVNSWIDGKGNPREVTLCNASRMCGRYQYIKLSGMFQRLGTRFPDPKYGNCGVGANCLPM